MNETSKTLHLEAPKSAISTPSELRADWKSRFAAPATARAGETLQIRTLLAHPMESGYRRDNQGEPIPRNIITRFECHYLEQLVFSADFFPAVAANPYLAFELIARRSGDITCYWADQQGRWATAQQRLEVS